MSNFKYGDKVKIKSGFFEGHKGVCKDSNSHYVFLGGGLEEVQDWVEVEIYHKVGSFEHSSPILTKDLPPTILEKLND